MANNRLFTEEEIKAMSRHTLEVLEETIDAGDGERAKRLANRMYREFLAMHDLYRDWVTSLLTFIGKRYGDEVFPQAFEESFGTFWNDLVERYPEDDPRRVVHMLAFGLRGHLQPLHIEEDDEKITIEMTPCGSGGRLVQGGAYEPPRSYLKIKRAQPMTFGNEGYPVYCTHCFFQNALPIWAGKRLPFVTYGSPRPGDLPCQMVVYKDPDKAVPPDVYESAQKARQPRAP